MEPVLEIKNLKVRFTLEEQVVEALKGISFSIYPKEIVALVGESGSGKSVTCYSILNLLPKYADIEGSITFRKDNKKIELLRLNEKQLRNIRGNDISMVFQEPSAVLNPLFTVGHQIVETILSHRDINKEEAKEIAIDVMRKVHIPEPERRFYQYPHELSGGLKQRVAIAIAIVNNPLILLADEPTTALDIEGRKILFEILHEFSGTIIIATHVIDDARKLCERVIVIDGGVIKFDGDL